LGKLAAKTLLKEFK